GLHFFFIGQPVLERVIHGRPGHLSLNVLLQVLLKCLEVCLECRLETLDCGTALRQHIQEWANLWLTLSLVAKQEVVDERPRLGIEDSLLLSFIVVRRIATHRKERLQRKKASVSQRQHVLRYRPANTHLLVLIQRGERAVILGNALIEPGRSVRKAGLS